MSEFYVTLPLHADRPAQRPGDPFDQLAQVGRAAELAALTGALAPFDPEGDESLVVSAALLRQSRHLRLVAGIHPAAATPVYAAKISASLQRFSGGRLDWWLQADLPPAVARAHGDFHTGADRQVRAEEFLTVARGVWTTPGYTFRGRFFEVLDGGFQPPLSGRPFPRVFLSGDPDLSVHHADVHVYTHGQPVAPLPGVELGLRVRVLAREDDHEAVRPAGFDGLSGSYESVAAELRRYEELGVSHFFLEAEPYLEETYRLGEHLLPLLARETADAR
ncbi:MAG: LLM class flavin-dependent oxidoreductase [Nonomuraea sp.]|nr:LLM class flavin-dependent oxidoreductase [Nonomuraea sp.]